MNLSSTIERRYIEAPEFRLDADGEQRTIKGYAAVFDSLSQPLFGFREVIRKGAFKKTLRDADIRALFNHDPNYVLGRKSARTLQLSEDEKGLSTRIFPPNTQWASDLLESIDRGDVSQMSFGFQTVKDNWLKPGDDGLPVRELLEVRLFDVSPVTFPAYPQTEVHVRALMDSMLWKLNHRGGELSKEERGVMAQVLDNLKERILSEPGQPHSGQQRSEPGQPHSETPEPEPGTPHSEEQRRAAFRAIRERFQKFV